MTTAGRQGLRWSIAVLLLVVLPQAPIRAAGEYRTVEVESLRITIDSEWGARTAPGYLPVRFDITNLGDARVIEIAAEGYRFFRTYRGGSPPGMTRVRQALRLARGDRVRFTVPVPVMADSENIHFDVREDGRVLESFAYSALQSGVAAADASALIVADPSSPFGQVAATLPRPMTAMTRPSLSGGRTSGPLDFLLEPARLPANWIGYTSLRAVIIGPAEWDQLNDAQKGALLTWTACGGDLVFADGELNALSGGGHAPPAAAPDGAVRAYFFGRIHRPTSASLASQGLTSVLNRATSLQDGNWALPANRVPDWAAIAARGFRFTIPGIDGVPARAYLSILILFSVLIGPANYWLLWRKRQHVLFVLTVPLISTVFILVLAGYVLAGEGLGVRGRAVTFTMLDEPRHQAVTRASASLYAAGMAPGGGLRFPRDAAVYPIGPDGTGNRDTQALDLTETQRFSSGVIHARAPTNVEQVAFRAARERLAYSREGDTMAVVNGLGVTVLKLRYRVGETVYALAHALPPGSKGTLNAGAADPVFVPAEVPLAPRFLPLVARQPDGSYLAILERSPFWEPGVSRVEERGSFHLVIGWPEGQR